MSAPESGRVTLEYIEAQRIANFPDMHPEDYCHRCGGRNVTWYAPQDIWQEAVKYQLQRGISGICCPSCLVQMHEAATGERLIWKFQPDVSLVPRNTPDGAS